MLGSWLNMKTPALNLVPGLLLIVLGVGLSTSIIGCSSSVPPPVVDPVRLDKAQKERAIFDKVDGDYDKLAGPDREEFIKLTGLTADKAKAWWVVMKYGLNGPPPGKGAGGPK